MIAFISDIHANLPALEAVFADIERLGSVEKILCLGDVIGYGPRPIETLELVASRCKLMLMGNHEHAVLHGAFGFHAAAKRAVDWTREQLQEVSPGTRRKALWSLIEDLPIRHEIELRVPKFTHATQAQGERAALAEAAKMLVAAQAPVIIADRAVRSQTGEEIRMRL